jgi:hypothetical protein
MVNKNSGQINKISKNKKLYISGYSTNNIPVYANVFYYYGEIGVDLELIFEFFKDKNILIDWIHFFKCAKQAGWSLDKMTNVLRYEMKSIYGEEYYEHAMSRLTFVWEAL